MPWAGGGAFGRVVTARRSVDNRRDPDRRHSDRLPDTLSDGTEGERRIIKRVGGSVIIYSFFRFVFVFFLFSILCPRPIRSHAASKHWRSPLKYIRVRLGRSGEKKNNILRYFVYIYVYMYKPRVRVRGSVRIVHG